MAKGIGIRIDGYVSREDDKELDEDEFLDAFLEFVESRNWLFAGHTVAVDEDGEVIPNKEE